LSAIHILLAAPPGLVRDGIARVVRELGPAVEVRCVDPSGGIFTPEVLPSLIVLDGDSHSRTAHAVQALHAQMPSIPVVVLLTNPVPAAVEELLAAGIAGCVDKSTSAEIFLGALRVALAGGSYVSPSLIPAAYAPSNAGAGTASLPVLPTSGKTTELTPRQLEVLALAARGESNKSIARRLAISEGTVKIHLTAVYRALNVNSRTQASNIAIHRQDVVDEQVRHAFGAGTAIGRLMPHMTRRKVKARSVLFTKGDTTDALYYVLQGVLHLDELGIEVGPGTLLGEVGLFTPQRRRTLTARCKTDLDLLWITASDAMRVCYRDPEFAVYLMHLITSRLVDSRSRQVRGPMP
jgi:two-component system nitrate/nitrite response regulator NarL